MLLSIIIRTWNRLEYTVRTIVSIDKNSGLNRDEYEIICVDQGSMDGTREWLRSLVENKYYPIKPIFLESNIGDGLGMQKGIEIAQGEFIAQHDNDIEILGFSFYKDLISLYRELEAMGYKVCSVGGSHFQGTNLKSAPFRFAQAAGKSEVKITRSYSEDPKTDLVYYFAPTAWNTGVFIFRKEFTEVPFTKGMCNRWGGEWFDRGYDHFLCKSLTFWHIDSGETGANIQRQHDKFPDYEYIFTHYRNFINLLGGKKEA